MMLSVLALLFSVALSAADPADVPADVPKTEETIIVTATRSERKVSELPVSTTVVREEEIRSAPVRSVDDLIRSVPGVAPTITSGSGSVPNTQRFSMHGLGGTRALVLLDGIPIHDPYSGIVQWQTVPLQSLKQIEVVRGGNASLFGNYALGGTVNLITPRISNDDVALDLSWGSNDTSHGALTVDHAITDALAVRVSRFQTNSDGFLRVPETGPIDIPAWIDNAITSARVQYDFTDHTSAFVNATTSQIDISQGTPETYSKRDINAFSGGIQHGLGANQLLIVNAYTQRQSERLINSNLLGKRESEWKSQDSTIPATGSGASAEWTLQRSGPLAFIAVGVDLQTVEANERRTVFNRNGAITQREQVGGEQRFTGVFAQASWRPSSRVEVLGSARVDWFRNTNGHDTIEGGTDTQYAEQSSREFDPRVSVRYAASEHVALRASAYRAFNAPPLRDLYRANQTGGALILGNPRLTPETLTGGEASVEWAGSRGRAEVVLYQSTIENMQARKLITQTPLVYQFFNLGTGRSRGVEAMGQMRFGRRWEIETGYTYADAVITSDPSPALVGNWLQEVPRHFGTLGVRFHGEHGTNVNVRGMISGRSYSDAGNTALSIAHRVVDVSVSHPVRSWLDVYALGENIFDERYWFALGATTLRLGLPRTITGGVRINGLPWRTH